MTDAADSGGRLEVSRNPVGGWYKFVKLMLLIEMADHSVGLFSRKLSSRVNEVLACTNVAMS